MTQELHPPRGINAFNAIAKPLLAAGVPMGFNGLLTVPGRKTGIPRTTPLAIIEVGGRRWVWSPWGEVNWVRNLRAAGEAEVKLGGQMQPMRAVELDEAQSVRFFRDTVQPYIARLPRLWRAVAQLIMRGFAPEVLTDPVLAAARHPVFELQRLAAGDAAN